MISDTILILKTEKNRNTRNSKEKKTANLRILSVKKPLNLVNTGLSGFFIVCLILV